MIEKYGGEYIGENNLLNPNTLDWVLGVIQHPIFGITPYPKLSDKAAIMAWKIISQHVFFDGNKRTGMATAILFLDANHFQLVVPNNEIIKIALNIANHQSDDFSFSDLSNWIELNSCVRKNNDKR